MDPFEFCANRRPRSRKAVQITTDNLDQVAAAVLSGYVVKERTGVAFSGSGRMRFARIGEWIVAGHEMGIWVYQQYTDEEYQDAYRPLTEEELA
ncbi:hypothetical protein [Nocardiopsis sp. NPDC058789]|uniref:hypothetical protein n=1 Tax=Nocardiopsis sp. NPDC058789 TaxID=3346634 RepID=UPI0036725942